MEANTAAIIRLAWCRRLGLADGALENRPDLITVQGDDALVAVRLFDSTVLSGPSEALRAAEDDPGRVLEGADLLRLLGGQRQRTARLARATGLRYADQYSNAAGLEEALISEDPVALAAVQRCCPPDDVLTTALGGTGRRYVLHDPGEIPVAAAGVTEWQQLIGTLTVLVGLPYRRQGYGQLVAAAATNDLIDAGLVPEWRAPEDHPPSATMARRLGYQSVGSVTAISLEPSA